MVRKNGSIKGLNILGFEFKLTSFADDSSFFLADQPSVNFLLETFSIFSKFSGLMLNESKCEIAPLGALRGSQVSIGTLKYVDLCTDSIKILGIHFSYDKNIANTKNYEAVVEKIQMY